MSNTDDQKKKPSGPPQMSDLILNSLKPRTGKETSKWIAGLADDAIREAAEAAAHEQAALNPATSHNKLRQSSGKQMALKVTESIFDCFQQYEFDFNATVKGTDYVVNIERPTYVNETVKLRFQAAEQVQVFRGRISTRRWTMIIRAFEEKIEGWILPVEQIFSFRADENYEPYFTVEPAGTRDSEMIWKVGGAHLNFDEMRDLAKELFAGLIRVARDEQSASDKFVMHTHTDSGAASAMPTMPQQMANTFSGLNPANSSGGFQSPYNTGQQRRPELQRPDHPMNAGFSFNEEPFPTSSKYSSNEPSIDAVFDMLNRLVNRELEKLSAAGADAFAKQDMAAVERTFRRTTRIKEVHAQMSAALNTWKQALSDATEA